MRKRLLGLALACSMAVVSLAGCNGSGNAMETTKAAAAGDTILKWAVWDINLTTYYQPLIDAFEAANPGVKIEMVDLGSADYDTVLTTELTGSGSGLDIAMMKDIPGYTTMVKKGVLEPLDDYIAKDSVDLSVYGGIDEQVKIDGKIYQLPFRSDFWLVYYNKDIFDQAGVAYPTNDMTLEQYDELARSVADTTPGQEVYGSHYHTWRSAVQLIGVLDGKNSIVGGQYDFLKPYYEVILAEQNDGVCQDYATLKTTSMHYSGAFGQGNIAMMNMGSWFIPTLAQKVKTGEYGPEVANWGVVKYPHPEGVEPGTTMANITGLAVPSSAPNKDLAWEFVKFVSGPDGAEVVAGTGNMPAIKTDAVVEAVTSMEGFPTDPESAEALRTANLYLEMPIHEKNSEIDIILNEAHDAIMTGSCTLDEGITQMNEKVSAVLSQ